MAKRVRGTKQSSGQPIAVDPLAKSARRGEPAFIAPPDGAPVYYGFPILKDVEADGFTLGKITDFEASHCDSGDAFIVAPDGSRAGIVWTVSDSVGASLLLSPEPRRWGVWEVSFVLPMTSRENARLNLLSVLPFLKEQWQEWRIRK